MINLILLIVINSLVCVGLYRSFQFEYRQAKKDEYIAGIDIDGYKYVPDNDTKAIFWFWKYYVLDRINYRVSKPFGNCLTCMASVYSIIPYWFYQCELTFSDYNLIFYPFYILALAGLNTIFAKLIED